MAYIPLLAAALNRARYLVFGYDFFISYAHHDGKDYATRLERALVGMDFAVFRDEEEIHGGDTLSLVIRWSLRRTRCLLLLGTRQALTRPWIAKEVSIFRDTKRRIAPIDVQGIAHEQTWFEPDELVFLSDLEGLEGPSERVLRDITSGARRWRANRLARWALGATMLSLAGLVGLSLFYSHRMNVERNTAIRNLHTANARELALGSDDARQSAPQRSILLALEATAATHEEQWVEPSAQRALAESVRGIAGVPVIGAKRVEHTRDGIVAWDGYFVTWWNLTEPARETARIAIPLLHGNDDSIDLVPIHNSDRVVLSTGEVAMLVRADGSVESLLREKEDLASLLVLADGRTILTRICYSCPDWDAEIEAHGGHLGAADIMALPPQRFVSAAWALNDSPVRIALQQDPFQYGRPQAPCGTLVLARTKEDSQTLLQWTGSSLTPVVQPDTREGRVTASAFSADCQTWVTGSSDGIVRVWRLTEPTASRILQPPKSNAPSILERAATFQAVVPPGQPAPPAGSHPSGITALGFVGEGHLVIGQGDGTVDLWSWTGANAETFRASVKHAGAVDKIVVSPDGLRFATWSGDFHDEAIRGASNISSGDAPIVWDLTDVIRVESLDQTWATEVHFGNDNRWIATESGTAPKSRVALWYWDKGKPRLVDILDHAEHAQFSARTNGLYVISGLLGEILRFSLADGNIDRIETLQWHESPVVRLIEDPRGQWLVSADSSSAVARWRFEEDGRVAPPWSSHVSLRLPSGALKSAAVADDGRWVALLGDRGQALVGTRRRDEPFSITSIGSNLITGDSGTDNVVILAANPSADRIAVVLQTKHRTFPTEGPTRIEILDASGEDGRPGRYVLHEQDRGIHSAHLLMGGRWLLVQLAAEYPCPTPLPLSDDCPTIQLWDLDLLASRRPDREFAFRNAHVDAMNGWVVAESSDAQSVSVLRLEGSEPTKIELPSASYPNATGIDPRGRWVVVESKSGETMGAVGFQSLSSARSFIPVDRGDIYRVSYANDGQRAVLRFFSGSEIWDLTQEQPTRIGSLDSSSEWIFFDKAGDWLIDGEAMCMARFSEPGAIPCSNFGKPPGRPPGTSNSSLFVGDDSTWFVSGHDDGSVRFWRTDRSQVPKSRIVTQVKARSAPHISGAGRYFAIAAENRIEAWEVKDGAPVRLWEDAVSGRVEDLDVTRGGGTWVKTSDAQVHYWPAQPADPAASARVVLGRTFSDEEMERWRIADKGSPPDAWWRVWPPPEKPRASPLASRRESSISIVHDLRATRIADGRVILELQTVGLPIGTKLSLALLKGPTGGRIRQEERELGIVAIDADGRARTEPFRRAWANWHSGDYELLINAYFSSNSQPRSVLDALNIDLDENGNTAFLCGGRPSLPPSQDLVPCDANNREGALFLRANRKVPFPQFSPDRAAIEQVLRSKLTVPGYGESKKEVGKIVREVQDQWAPYPEVFSVTSWSATKSDANGGKWTVTLTCVEGGVTKHPSWSYDEATGSVTFLDRLARAFSIGDPAQRNSALPFGDDYSFRPGHAGN